MTTSHKQLCAPSRKRRRPQTALRHQNDDVTQRLCVPSRATTSRKQLARHRNDDVTQTALRAIEKRRRHANGARHRDDDVTQTALRAIEHQTTSRKRLCAPSRKRRRHTNQLFLIIFNIKREWYNDK